MSAGQGTSKGTELVNLRRLLHQLGPETEETYLAGLPSHLRIVFRSLLTSTRIPIDQASELYDRAARLLYPESPRPNFELGRRLAQNTYRGVYGFILRIPSIRFVLAQAAQVWRLYYDRGVARIENFTENSADFVVADYPDLPQPIQEGVGGNFACTFELTGLKEVRIVFDAADPENWRWRATWRKG